jgi:hypothetical protein
MEVVMGKIGRARRGAPGDNALLRTLALLAVIWVALPAVGPRGAGPRAGGGAAGSVWAGLGPSVREASAAPNGFADPPAPPALGWPAENPVLDSEEVGFLPGGGTVTAMGDYQYTLPIELPAGRAGMAPEIALRYSSRGGNTANGIAGVGFALSYGGSEITRCPRSFLHDGKTDAPNWNASDALCLDGTRMLVVNGGQPMAEGTEYRTFRDSFTRIVAHAGAGETGQEGADAWFETFEKDGRIRVYEPIAAKRLPPSQAVWPNGDPNPAAGDPPADVTAVWVMTSERDRSGNAILYDYEVEPAEDPPYALEYRISSIEYTAVVDAGGNVIDASRRKIVLEYSLPEERPDPLFHYQNGVRTAVSRRLTRIKIYAPNPVLEDLIGQYAFAYEPGQERSFLSSVHRLDDSGFRRMWERTFEWAHDDRPHFAVVDPPLLAGAFHEGSPLLFDADNDGKADLLVDGKLCRTTAGSLVPFDMCVSGAATAGIWGRPADVDGDGKTDVLRQTPGGVAYATWNGATGTFEPLDYGLPASSNLGDADGDGRIDVWQLGPRVNPNADHYEQEWYLRLNTGSGFAEPIAPLFAAPFTPGRKGAVLDLDGNGRAEFHSAFHAADEPPNECAFSPSPPWDYHAVGLTDGGTLVSNVTLPQGSPCRRVLLDANGDGLDDLVVAGPLGVSLRYNTGTRFLPSESAGALFYPRLGRHDFEVADIDGDGRADLVSSHEASSFEGQDHLPGTYLYLRRNDGFERMSLLAAP